MTSHPEAALATIRENISASAAKYGCEKTLSPTIIAVSKTFGVEAITPFLEAGQREFGENRVQEAQEKWPGLKKEYSDVVLHLIGPLQSNKAADAVALFDVIHTIDREKIARAVKKECDKQGRTVDCLIQINTGDEERKAGIAPEEADDFIRFCRDEAGLTIKGLMCIPPLDDEPSPHFAWLAQKAREHALEWLSMGMSADYGIAACLGATHIRLGTALLGPRD